MNQSRYLAFIIVLCSVSMVFAMAGGGGSSQKTFRGFEGKVTDENGKVLNGVQVTIFKVDAATVKEVKNSSESNDKKSLSTTTGNHGRYRFVAVRPGIYKVRYEIPGYQTLEKFVELKRGSKDAMINIQLRGIAQPVPAAGQQP